MKNLDSPFDQTRQWLSTELHQIEHALLNIVVSRFDLPHKAVDDLSAAGGKRIRALLNILPAKQELDTIIPYRQIKLAALVEAIHLISLIHDDVVDEAETRRNRPAINFSYGNKFAVLLGDFAYARVFRALVDDFDRDVMDLLASSVVEVSEGALFETICMDKIDLTEDDYYQVVRGKTASLFGATLALGCLLSDDMENTQTWQEAGIEFGFCYQIIDDVLDFSGDASLGKARFSDLPSGRLTLPVIKLLSAGLVENRLAVEKVLNGDMSVKDQLLSSLSMSGSLKYAIDKAFEHSKKALSLVNSLPASEGKTMFEAICRWLPQRYN